MVVGRKVWTEKFGDWFRNIITESSILDYRYPLKGCGIWLPFGFKLRNNILNTIRKMLDETGHEEVLLPLLIPEDLLAKESVHVHGFEEEIYWITHGGSTPLNVRLALRPTSETVITPMAKLWIRSHADLPKMLYQIGSIFRYETKATKPLIRVREVTTFKEAHTFHSTHKNALEQVAIANKVYGKIFEQLNLPYMLSKRPDWDKFSGALATYAFDTVFPDGRTLQIGTVHDLGQNFSKAFDFTFEAEEGERDYVWQTCYGISERIVAAVIAIHGDDHGLVLPPIVAPTQVVFIPILYKGLEEDMIDACKTAKALLEEVGFRVKIDDRVDLTPGSKFYFWEQRGVPIRAEIGPQELKNGEVTLVRRDTLEKSKCKMQLLVDSIRNLMALIGVEMGERAQSWFKERVHKTISLAEAKKLLRSSKGIVEVPWCGNDECGSKMETETDARLLGVPEDHGEEVFGTCVICGGKSNFNVRIAKAY